MSGPARSAIAFNQHLGLVSSLGVHLTATHEDGGGMLLKVFVPAGFGTGLHEPELVVGVNAEFRIHNHAAVSLAYGAHPLGHALGLTQRKCPAQGLKLGHVHFSGSAPFVIDDLHVLAAHLADNHFTAIIALEDIKLVGRDLATHHGLAEAITGVDAHKLPAVGTPAASGRVRGKSRAGNHRIDHLHHANGKGGVLNGPLFLGVFGNGLVARFFGLGQRIQNGLTAVSHGAQVIGRGTVPVIGFHDPVFNHHVEVGILKTGKSLFARVFTGSGRPHGHGGHVIGIIAADFTVSSAHGFADLGGKLHRKYGGLHHDRAFAQLVNAFRRGGETFHDIIDKGTQLGM